MLLTLILIWGHALLMVKMLCVQDGQPAAFCDRLCCCVAVRNQSHHTATTNLRGVDCHLLYTQAFWFELLLLVLAPYQPVPPPMSSVQELTPPKKRVALDVLQDSPDQPKLKQRKPDRLSAEQRKQLTLLGKGVGGDRQGLSYDTSTHCSICCRAKHTCDWEYRRGGTPGGVKRIVTGSYCASCVKACRAVNVSRSLPILKKVAGVIAIVRSTSSEIAAANATDVCQCSDCGGRL